MSGAQRMAGVMGAAAGVVGTRGAWGAVAGWGVSFDHVHK